MRRCCRINCAWILAIVLVFTAFGAFAAPGLTLGWDRNNDPVTGYMLHYGTARGVYTRSLDAGNSVTVNIPDLVAGLRYYFVVTAYNSDRVHSLYSNEVSAVVPTPPTLAVSSPQQGEPLPANGVVAAVSQTITADRRVSIWLSSPAQSAITVFASQNCSSWIVLGTVPNPTGRIVIQDLQSPNFERRYYRFSRIELPP